MNTENFRDELKQMALAAHLYYEEGQTQDEVCRTIGLSRPTVSRLLRRAKEEGIVQIRIRDPFVLDEQLAGEIVQAFGIQSALVAPAIPGRPDLSLKWLGLVAARYLEQHIQANEVIGVGWGRTLSTVSQSLSDMPKDGVRTVPLLGGLGQISPNFQVHEITRAIATAFNGEWTQVYIPALVDNESLLQSLVHSPDFQKLVESWSEVTTALVGIGNLDFDAEMQVLFAKYLDAATRNQLAREGAIGDICMRFFDIQGNPVDGLPGVTGISLNQIRAIKRVIAVAGGIHKTQAILGALKGGWIQVLITDDLTARQILLLSRSAK